MCAKSLQTCPTLRDPWTVALQTPLSMRFSRQEYWSGLPFPSPGDRPDPGIEPASLMSNLHWQVGSLQLAPPGKPVVKQNFSQTQQSFGEKIRKVLSAGK